MRRFARQGIELPRANTSPGEVAGETDRSVQRIGDVSGRFPDLPEKVKKLAFVNENGTIETTVFIPCRWGVDQEAAEMPQCR